MSRYDWDADSGMRKWNRRLRTATCIFVVAVGSYIGLTVWSERWQSERPIEDRIAKAVRSRVMAHLQHPLTAKVITFRGPTDALPDALYSMVVDSWRDGVMVREFYECHVVVEDQTPSVVSCASHDRRPVSEWK